MKIYGIYLIEKIITGGNRRYVELMNGFAKKGHAVSVFVNPKCAEAFSDCKVISVPIVLKKNRRISVQLAKQFENFLKNNSIDKADYCIVFGETDWLNAKILQKHSNTPIAFCYRSDVITDNKTTLKYERISLKKKVLLYAQIGITRLREIDITRKAEKIIFQTENDKNVFLKRNKKADHKCSIIPNDILRPRFSNELKNKNTSHECKNLLFVGEYTQRKGFNFLLQALILLNKQNIDFTCSVIARKEPSQKLLINIKANKLEEKITFLPQTDHVMPKMLQHDLVIVPSLFDSYPNVIMEAIHTGTPVIASNTSGMPYMLEYPALLFETAHPESIADSIKKCISDTSHYLYIKKLCHSRRAFFEFDWIQEWEKYLQEIDT